MAAEGLDTGTLRCEASLDLCYEGQAYALNVPWQSEADAQARFHTLHERRYGHRLSSPVELVNVRLAVRLANSARKLPYQPQVGVDPDGQATVFGLSAPVPVWPRAALPIAEALAGPLIVTDAVATTYVAPDWVMRRDRYGNMMLQYEG